MSDHSEAKKLIEQHADKQVSVMFLPEGMFEKGAKAEWIGHETRDSLREALELIVAEQSNFAGFSVHIHLGDKDELLSQESLAKLVNYVRTTGPSEN